VIPTSFFIGLVSCTYDINGPADGPILQNGKHQQRLGLQDRYFISRLWI